MNKKARKVCVGRGPWSGSAVKDGLAHRMGRRGRCGRVAVLVVGVGRRMCWPIEWEGEEGVCRVKALEWEFGEGWFGS